MFSSKDYDPVFLWKSGEKVVARDIKRTEGVLQRPKVQLAWLGCIKSVGRWTGQAYKNYTRQGP